jgi:isopenicillin N synthase-like dioxygenase
VTVLRVLGEKFGLDSELLPSLHKIDRAGGDHARVTWTPPGSDENAITFGAHTDFGSVTILFNKLGGLQVINEVDTEWTYVKPVPECAILNFGDSAVKLLGGRVKSGMHRVVSAPGDQARLPRVSVAYFLRPNGDVQLRSLMPGDRLEEGKVMTADEWIVHRAVHRHTDNYKSKDSFLLSKGTEHRDLD